MSAAFVAGSVRITSAPHVASVESATPLDISALLHDVAERFQRRADDDGRRICVDAPTLRVEADHVRLEQALVNLVENAFRHAAGTITLTGSPAPNGAEIHVADEGPGFPNGVAATAFERFTRGDAARTSSCAGLGLAIVKAIVQAHGGSVTKIMGTSVRVIEKHYGAPLEGAHAGTTTRLDARSQRERSREARTPDRRSQAASAVLFPGDLRGRDLLVLRPARLWTEPRAVEFVDLAAAVSVLHLVLSPRLSPQPTRVLLRR